MLTKYNQQINYEVLLLLWIKIRIDLSLANQKSILEPHHYQLQQ